MPSPYSTGARKPSDLQGLLKAWVIPHMKQPPPSHNAQGAHLTPAGGTDSVCSILQVTRQVHGSSHHSLDEVHRVEEGREGLMEGKEQLWVRLGANSLTMSRLSGQCGGHQQPLLQSRGLALLPHDAGEPGTASPASSCVTTLLYARTYNEVS